MHMYVAARAIRDRLNRWENDLLAQRFPFRYAKNYDGTYQVGELQLAMRPIQPYEIAFPAEHLEAVLKLVNPRIESVNKSYNKYIRWFAKLLGLKSLEDLGMKMPEHDGKVRHDDVDCTLIGFKEDVAKEETVSPKDRIEDI